MLVKDIPINSLSLQNGFHKPGIHKCLTPKGQKKGPLCNRQLDQSMILVLYKTGLFLAFKGQSKDHFCFRVELLWIPGCVSHLDTFGIFKSTHSAGGYLDIDTKRFRRQPSTINHEKKMQIFEPRVNNGRYIAGRRQVIGTSSVQRWL